MQTDKCDDGNKLSTYAFVVFQRCILYSDEMV